MKRMAMMRRSELNVWYRLGIVLTVLWLIGGTLAFTWLP